ncbi:hypothetical protein PG997_014439 [Apiospora hydei]|uniref:Uncharacterized protein n=1 Tax=Apiospora hydei TaxID=1337664 RepID=A0ABR1UTT3_9PEZI
MAAGIVRNMDASEPSIPIVYYFGTHIFPCTICGKPLLRDPIVLITNMHTIEISVAEETGMDQSVGTTAGTSISHRGAANSTRYHQADPRVCKACVLGWWPSGNWQAQSFPSGLASGLPPNGPAGTGPPLHTGHRPEIKDVRYFLRAPKAHIP